MSKLEDDLGRLIAEAEKKSGKAKREKKEKREWREHWEKHTEPRRNSEVHRPLFPKAKGSSEEEPSES